MRSITTGSWPPRSPCAIASSTAGSIRPGRPYRDGAQARLLPLARVPDRTAAVRRAVQPRSDVDGARGARRARRRSRPAAHGSNPTRRSATAAWAASPRATWKAWRRSRSRRTATASATITASSGRCMQGRLAARDARGLARRSATRGSSSGPRSSTRSASAARSRTSTHARRQRRATSGARPNRSPPSPTTRRSPAGAAGTSTRCGCGRRAPRPAVARRFQSRRPRRRAGRPRAAGGDFARALSERRHAGGRGLAPAPGVLLRVGVAAGPGAPAQEAARRTVIAAGPRRDPAERHASGHRRRRADAHPGRRARHAVGPRVADHDRRCSTTRTTRCCRKRSKPGPCR